MDNMDDFSTHFRQKGEKQKGALSSKRFWGLFASWTSLGIGLCVIIGMIFFAIISVITLEFLRGEKGLFAGIASSLSSVAVPCVLITGAVGIVGIMAIKLYRNASPVLFLGSAAVLVITMFIYLTIGAGGTVLILLAPILLYVIAGMVSLGMW
ncbi:hypothetical protein [Shouchella lonarensis]|uniref:Uncharacterized protein n=1 Tax=Shouchella lonarensis TaxID=1464122 RepID=A0A1G6HYJ3_9BACI|nr:hypothetical protein [Shouchella lonarensis]SDB99260.1 hypothetical protein SAMN05421737_104234 [Shouchella lonarensis]